MDVLSAKTLLSELLSYVEEYKLGYYLGILKEIEKMVDSMFELFKKVPLDLIVKLNEIFINLDKKTSKIDRSYHLY